MSRFGAQLVQPSEIEVPPAIDDAGTPGAAADQAYPRFRDTEGASLAGFAQNLKESGQRNVAETMQMFKRPDEALQAVFSLATSPDTRRALMTYADESYGSFENFKRSLYNDPIGVASELSVAGVLMRGPGMLGKVGRIVEHLDPGIAATTAAKAGAGWTGTQTGFPQRTIEQRLKMSPAPTSRYANPAVRDRVVETILEENLPISSSGVSQMDTRITKASKELDRLIDIADKSGKQIPIDRVLRPLFELRKTLGDPRTNPESRADIRAINSYLTDWMDELGPVQSLKPSQVRTLRQGLDGKLNFNRVPTTEPPIRTQMREEVAHGARRALNEGFDAIGQQNARVSRLLEAYEPMQRAANRIENNNRMSLRGTLAGTAGLAGFTLGDSTLDRALGLVVAGSGYLLNGATKEKLARAIYANKNLDEASKRTIIRQITDTAVEAGSAEDKLTQPEEDDRIPVSTRFQ